MNVNLIHMVELKLSRNEARWLRDRVIGLTSAWDGDLKHYRYRSNMLNAISLTTTKTTIMITVDTARWIKQLLSEPHAKANRKDAAMCDELLSSLNLILLAEKALGRPSSLHANAQGLGDKEFS